MVLTVRAVRWAVDALSYDDTTVSALARHLGVDWQTCSSTPSDFTPASLEGSYLLGRD
jgi:hypothetical protein